MSDRFNDSDATKEVLSALADGEAHSAEVTRACATWRDQADVRASWHAYHLIGDVMRSEDLAQASPSGDFLNKFRERLAQEPVVLAPSAAQAQRAAAVTAPQQLVAPSLHRRAWAGPVAVAAGFVLVVGALLSSQILPTGGASADGSLASLGAMPSASGDLSLAGGNALVPAGMTIGGAGATFSRPGEVVLIRDPQLDHALALQRASQASERSFEGQGAMARQVVFDGR